jgi:hypothetical protein
MLLTDIFPTPPSGEIFPRWGRQNGLKNKSKTDFGQGAKTARFCPDS